jgi:hypothetical protein
VREAVCGLWIDEDRYLGTFDCHTFEGSIFIYYTLLQALIYCKIHTAIATRHVSHRVLHFTRCCRSLKFLFNSGIQF